MILEKIPDLPRKLPIYLLPNEILLPGSGKTITISTAKNKNLVNKTLQKPTNPPVLIGVIQSLDIGAIGTAAFVRKVTNTSIIVAGIARFQINKIITVDPYMIAKVTHIDKHVLCEENNQEPEILELVEKVHDAVQSMYNDSMMPLLKTALQQIPTCWLAETTSHLIPMSFEQQLQLLNIIDIKERLKFVLKMFQRTEKGIGNTGRAIVVRNRMNTGEINDLEKLLEAANLPQEIKAISKRDLKVLNRVPTFNPEYGVVYSYLSLLADLPWNKLAEETLDLFKAKNDLEVDHYGLEQVKKRILEYLAVRKLRNASNSAHQSPVLCLVGPPGVGKTSVARSVASTLNRPFVRVSLGGVSSMIDIRGHRRTYVGAMPGRIIQAIRQSRVKNPVILLDEIDKMTSGLHGNPAAALLEVLDPSQNTEFVDHYLNVPFDLSQIMFIATANTLNNLSPALRDRMEMIKISGYTYLEKIQIALNHLLPKQLNENGLDSEVVHIPTETIQLLIHNYTQEAGVRELERKIGALCRSIAVQITMDKAASIDSSLPLIIDVHTAKNILGPGMHVNNKWTARLGKAGVAVGLVVTFSGGNTIAVETGRMPGSRRIVLTGNLGAVIKESAHLAWSWVRANASMYGVDLNGKRLSEMDIHIHFPAGAISKDGPSAGVTIASALMSLFLDRPLLSNVAMTGEITLQGLILPVGGIKEKVIAAHRDGFTKIIIPRENEKNLHDVPAHIKEQLTFVLVSDMQSVMEAAFDGGINLLLPQQFLKTKL